MTTFYTKVLNWATERNFPKGSKYSKQRTKTWEELSELATGMAKSNLDAERLKAIKDALGDCAVTTTNTAACLGLGVVQIGERAANLAESQRDTFDQYDLDGLLNLFIQHSSIVQPLDHKALAFDLPMPSHPEEHFIVALAALQHCAERLGLTFKECQDFAWSEIKHRKGTIVNGTYVKEADLPTTFDAVTKLAVNLAVGMTRFPDRVETAPDTASEVLMQAIEEQLVHAVGSAVTSIGVVFDKDLTEVTVSVVYTPFGVEFPVEYRANYVTLAYDA